MRKYLVGGVASLMVAAGAFWVWQGAAQNEIPAPPPPPALPEGLPIAAADAPKFGPAPPVAKEASKEEMRFNRYDRDRDNLISRIELMSSRTKAFKQLDKDGNNLLTFEEWAAATGERFAKADVNKDRLLTRLEFAATKPKPAAQPKCKC